MLSVAEQMEEECPDDSCRVLAGIVRDAAYKIRQAAMARGCKAKGQDGFSK